MHSRSNLEFQSPVIGSRRNRKAKKKGYWKALLVIFLAFVTVSLGAFSAIPHLMMKDMVNMHVDFKTYYKAEDYGISSEKLMLETSDGLSIAAHEVYEQNPKAVVIFISGIHNPSVTAFFDHARLLKENGYASILYEMRAHGESEGDVIALGFKEYLDTKAVVDYIKSSSKYQGMPVVVFGMSMGGATAINSIGQIEEIDGLISISAFSAWEDVFGDNMSNMGIPGWIADIQKPFVKLYTNIKYGFDTHGISPKKEIKKLGDRPALLMHSLGDTQVPYRSLERLVANAPSHIETWTREGDLHFFVENDGFTKLVLDPEYTERIIGFLDKHFVTKR